jgi:hypothetical protein
VLRITPDGAPSWDVAVGQAGWARTPNPAHIAVISDGSGYLLDVAERHVVFEEPGVIRIAEDELHDLVVFITDTDLIAYGRDAELWRTHDELLADFKVEATDSRGIVGSVYDRGLRAPVVFDPVTGRRI